MQNQDNRAGQWLTLRAGRDTLSFAMPSSDGSIEFVPYVVKSSISLSANLREAFKEVPMLQSGVERVRVLIDSPVLMTPVELFDNDRAEQTYTYVFPSAGKDTIFHNVLTDLNAVAVFSMNRDLRMVIDDHFQAVRLLAAISPVWRHLHQRSYSGPRHKLYGYFHEKRLEVFSFQQNRFKFCNSYETRNAHDALYFLLYVWQQLQLQPKYDEVHIVGDIPEQEWFLNQLNKYVSKAYVIDPAADFNHAPVTDIKAMPFDMQAIFVNGR